MAVSGDSYYLSFCLALLACLLAWFLGLFLEFLVLYRCLLLSTLPKNFQRQMTQWITSSEVGHV